MQRTLFAAGVAASLLAANAAAQNSILFAAELDQFSLAGGGGGIEAGLLREDEIAVVTPRPGSYSAYPFLSVGTQWAFLGDDDSDNRRVDTSERGPGDAVDAIFVKRFRSSGQFGARDIYMSKESTGGFRAVFEDGDVFRHSGQGQLDFFIREGQILTALGQPSNGDVDVDAICQDQNGNVYISFNTTEDVNGTSMNNGGFCYIPRSAITYDLTGNITLITPGSAVVAAQGSDVNSWIQNSGMQTSVRGNPTTSPDLSGLEIDPNGGTFSAPQQANLMIPNLLFAWDGFSNDGAILSTAGAGSIPTINGVALASTVETSGAQLGVLPDSTGIYGVYGLGLIPIRNRPPFVVENAPANLITTSTTLWSRREASGATPSSPVVFFFDYALGSTWPAISIPGFGGEIFGLGAPVVFPPVVADGNGFAQQVFTYPPVASGSGVAICWQALDLGSLTFALPAGVQFL